MSNSNSGSTNAYDTGYNSLYLGEEEYATLELDMDDDSLQKMLIDSMDKDKAYWNQAPFKLDEADSEYTKFVLGDQLDSSEFRKGDIEYKDNRLFTSTRAILSYATGQLARPQLTPSNGDKVNIRGARDTQAALYQHASDNKVDYKVRSAVMNLLIRKRGWLKLRFDPNIGLHGDIVTEVVNPEDIIVDRMASYLSNPNKIYQRLGCSIEELVSKFPDKREDILRAYGIVQGRYSQMSKYVHYFECAFTYMADGEPKEGVCWFIPEKRLVLDKMKNPNWIYLKSKAKEKAANVTDIPPKGFINFNYINLGHSYIDETCLIEQAMPLQKMLNKRGRQIMENADYVNGRWVASKKAFSDEDATKLINKSARTVAMTSADDANKALVNVASQALPNYVENTLYDTRTEIDQMMGTPSVFKGSQPGSQDTLGRDLLVKQQAGALQDDLVRSVAQSMEEYYKVLLQFMRVYYTDDYWFQVKGGDGKYQFILINGDKIDSNTRVSVQVDSTLPLDKAQVRATAMELWKAGNAIDYQTFMEDLGLPNPEERTERYLKQQLNPTSFLRSIELEQINTDAESDIQLLIANKVPEERDEYDAAYLNYFNKVMASNRFAKLEKDNPDAQQRIAGFLMAIQHIANDSANLQEVLDDAGMLSSTPPPQPIDPSTGQPITQPGQPLPGQQQATPGQPTSPQGMPVAPPQAPPAPPNV